jgi:hypothetical protein
MVACLCGCALSAMEMVVVVWGQAGGGSGSEAEARNRRNLCGYRTTPEEEEEEEEPAEALTAPLPPTAQRQPSGRTVVVEDGEGGERGKGVRRHCRRQGTNHLSSTTKEKNATVGGAT